MGLRSFRETGGGRGDKSGRRAFRTVRGSMETLEGNAGRTGRIPGTEKGTVTIGIPMNLGACILPVVVPVFRRRYPGVKVFIRENNSQELEK